MIGLTGSLELLLLSASFALQKRRALLTGIDAHYTLFASIVVLDSLLRRDIMYSVTVQQRDEVVKLHHHLQIVPRNQAVVSRST